MVNFEVFHRAPNRNGRRPIAEPALTITARSVINLSGPAYEALGSPAAVEVMTAREPLRIAFRKAAPGGDDSYRVRLPKRAFTGVRVCKYLGLDTSQSRRWPMLTSEDGTQYIDLSQPGTVVTSNRAKKKLG